MQKLKYLVENLDLAKNAISYWTGEKEALNRIAFYRASANSTYVYEQDHETYYLRIKPIEDKSTIQMIAEIQFIHYLTANNFNCIKVASPIGNEDFYVVDDIYYASIFEEAKGIRLDQVKLDQDIAYRLGTYLGKLHKLSIDYVPLADSESYLDKLRSFHTTNPVVLKEIKEIKDQILELDLIIGLIHYDFDLDNIFYDQDKKQFQVIDFDDAFCGYYMHDVMIALKSLDQKLHQSFLEGYHQVYKHETYDPSKLVLLERFDKLYQYIRLNRALSDIPENKPDWMEALIDKFTKIIRDYEDSLSKK